MARTVTFHAKYTEHELTRRPKLEQPLLSGGFQTVQQPLRYKFAPTKSPDGEFLIGELVVNVGQDKLVDHSTWLRPGEDQTVERDAADALRAHYNFGADFWEAPMPAVLFRKNLHRANTKLEEDTVLAMIAEEQRVANRRDLLDEANTVLEMIREMRAEMQAAAEAQEAEEQAKAKPAAKQKAATPA